MAEEWQGIRSAPPNSSSDVEGGVMDIQKEREVFEQWAFQASRGWASFDRDSNGKYWPDKLNLAWGAWQASKAQAVPEGFVLVPVGHNKFFSHDFNGDGFQYHDTLQEAKNAAKADLDIYRDRVADGNHIAEMGEFNELSYGIVLGQAEWSVDCVVSADDHKNGEYTQYDIGTEILSLYLSEAQEQGQ